MGLAGKKEPRSTLAERPKGGTGENLHGLFHLLKGAVSLLEESINNAFAEFPLTIIVHLQNLLEGGGIDDVFILGQIRRTFLGLGVTELTSCTINERSRVLAYLFNSLLLWKGGHD